METLEQREYYINREQSLLAFNKMILEEAQKKDVPLLERLKFLSIISSNLDEFFMIRVAGLKGLMLEERLVSMNNKENNGKSATATLVDELYEEVHQIQKQQYACLNNDVLPGMREHGLYILRKEEWTPEVAVYLEQLFHNEIESMLTPIAVFESTSNVFTAIGNLSIHIACWIEDTAPEVNQTEQPSLVFIRFPKNISRFFKLPGEESRFVLLDDILFTFCDLLYPGKTITEKILFKVTRDADIGVDELTDDNFVNAMEDVLINRQISLPLRMTWNGNSERLINYVAQLFNLHEREVFKLDGPLNLKSFMVLCETKGFDNLRYKKFIPDYSPQQDTELWDRLKREDKVVNFPYDSFKAIEDMFSLAARDPDVLAIKTTLYRMSSDSSIVRSLTKAARAGKQVTAIVELKARFDEAQNIQWANKLEQAGAIVVYGVMHLKIHAKACLIVRRERDKAIRQYAYVATGNFNEITAESYSDIGLMTANTAICRDLSAFFNVLTGLSSARNFSHISMAPYNLRSKLIECIEREALKSTQEQPGQIIAKMNALCDPEIIQSLYRASQQGVHIQLIVRGVCLLIPGVPGLSDNIEVRSIVGRFLEHSRIYYFRNGGNEELYLASADWMERNFDKRVEIMTPVLCRPVRDRLKELLAMYLKDNVQARVLTKEAIWKSIPSSEPRFSVQEYLITKAERMTMVKQSKPLIIPRKKTHRKQ